MLDPGPEVSAEKISYLEYAVNKGYWDDSEVDKLLSMTDQFNHTALFYLFGRKKIKNIQQFLEEASSEALSAACIKSPYSLINAAVWQTTEVFYQFVNKLSPTAIKAAIVCQDDQRNTALHLAMLNHNTDDLEILINKIVDSDSSNSVLQINANTYGTPLNIAAPWKDNEIFKILLQKAKADVISKIITIRGWRRSTLLYETIYNQNWNVIMLLINKTNEKEFAEAVQMKDWLGGWTVLHYAGRDDEAGDVLFEITKKVSLATIHPALSSAQRYTKTMFEIKKHYCPRNFVYLIFIQIFSYLICSHTEKKFKLENADWLNLLSKLNKTDKKDYLAIIKQHIKDNGNFWGGIFSIRYKDIRNLLLELSDTDTNIIEQAIIRSANFLSEKLRSNLDKNVREIEIVQQHLSCLMKITGPINTIKSVSSTKPSEDSKHSYVEALDLFKADPEFIRNKSKQEQIEQKGSKQKEQWEKKPTSKQNWSLSQQEGTKPDKEEEIDETNAIPNVNNG